MAAWLELLIFCPCKFPLQLGELLVLHVVGMMCLGFMLTTKPGWLPLTTIEFHSSSHRELHIRWH